MKKKLRLADLFCGAGGTTNGAIEAVKKLGYDVHMTAVNHWPIAVATHTANHPEARHLCASIDSTNPRELFAEGELDGLLASPECMGHSVALGGRPVNDQSRATAWCILRWLDALRPSWGLFENVPEFLKWAPLGSNGRPLKSREGEVFERWCDAVRSLNYKLDYKIVVCANYGDPTTRRRLFIQIVRGRRKIVWAHPTHSPASAPTLFTSRKWVSARRIIDWNVKGSSIFNRKRPLSPKTYERIWEGLEKFGGLPFILPKLMRRGDVADPARSVDEPLNTVITDGRVHLVEPFLIPQGGGGAARAVNEPTPTVACDGAISLIQPFLIAMEHGGRVVSLDEPMPTVTTAKGGAFAVAKPFLVQVNHGNGVDPKANSRRVRDCEQPLPTVCGNRGEWALCEPFVISAGGPECAARPVTEPLGTVLTRDHRALVQPFLLPQNSSNGPRSIEEPAPTLTSTSRGVALIEPFIVSYYGNGEALSVDQPLATVTTKDRFGLVQPVIQIDGSRYLLEVLFRMLQPPELAGAQSFPRSYIFTGNKTQVTKQIGNAVPRRTARALVGAIVSQNADVTGLLDDELDPTDTVGAA